MNLKKFHKVIEQTSDERKKEISSYLNELENKNNMKKYIIIEADTNDGDYITSINKISDENLELIKPIIEEIKKNNGDYTTGEQGSGAKETYGSMNNFNYFNSLVPHGEYGVHTIDGIDVFDVVSEQKLI